MYVHMAHFTEAETEAQKVWRETQDCQHPLRLRFKHLLLPPGSPSPALEGPLPSRGKLTCHCNSGAVWWS